MAPRVADTPLARLGNVEVSKFETATGARLRLRRLSPRPAEVYLDPLELEGLTRARDKPFPLLVTSTAAPPDHPATPSARTERMEPLQNEFAMVGVGVTQWKTEERLFIRDMNGGYTVLLSGGELEALLRARHMDFAPLIDTSDLVALPEPDIDEA